MTAEPMHTPQNKEWHRNGLQSSKVFRSNNIITHISKPIIAIRNVVIWQKKGLCWVNPAIWSIVFSICMFLHNYYGLLKIICWTSISIGQFRILTQVILVFLAIQYYKHKNRKLNTLSKFGTGIKTHGSVSCGPRSRRATP